MSPPPDAAQFVRGINVLGHHRADSQLGAAARSVTESLRAAAIEVTAIDVDAGRASELGEAPPTSRLMPTTIAVVPLPALPAHAVRHRDVFAATQLLIGYAVWDPAAPSDDVRAALAMVDRVWAPTRYVEEAVRRLASGGVELQPLHVPAPQPSDRTMSSFGVDAGFVFLTMFDQFDDVARVNATGVISAFGDAFAPTADVALLLKTVNGERRPEAHERLLALTAGDPRMRVIDARVDEADHAAFIAGADCLVSLDRADSLGVHLAEAMWLSTPVIAARYGATVDLLDDGCAALVDVRMADVDGPGGGQWAEPDIDQAADWMRRLATDREVSERLASAARRRVAAQPAASTAGLRMANGAVDAAMHPTAGGLSGVLRRAARSASSPVRNYLNNHFEMTKQEVRALRTGSMGGGAIDSEPLQRELRAVGDVVAELGVHHARLTAELRDEVSQLRDEMAELRADLGVLTAALLRAVERERVDSER